MGALHVPWYSVPWYMYHVCQRNLGVHVSHGTCTMVHCTMVLKTRVIYGMTYTHTAEEGCVGW